MERSIQKKVVMKLQLNPKQQRNKQPNATLS